MQESVIGAQMSPQAPSFLLSLWHVGAFKRAMRLTDSDVAGRTGGLVSLGEAGQGVEQERGAGLQEVVGRDRARPHQASGG